MVDHPFNREPMDDFYQLNPSQLSRSSPSRLPPFLTKRSRGPSGPANETSVQSPTPPKSSRSSNKPANLSHVPCKFFKQGTCTAGANCIFSHNRERSPEAAVCRYYLKGNCKFGTKCALLHTLSPLSDRSGKWMSMVRPASLPRDDDLDYDLNDAMLPSSLNDLFTPSELQMRKAREQQERAAYHSSGGLSSSFSGMALHAESMRSPPLPPLAALESHMSVSLSSSWKVTSPGPFSSTPSRSIPLPHPSSDEGEPFAMDDDVQFYMEDDADVSTPKMPLTTKSPAVGASSLFLYPSLVGFSESS